MFGLFTETFCKYRDEWIARTKKRSLKENLYILPVVALFVVIIYLFYKLFVMAFGS